MIWYPAARASRHLGLRHAAAPILMNLTVDGEAVRAVVQLTKQAFAYVFDRTNGVR
jgi:glucose dehydrogenase